MFRNSAHHQLRDLALLYLNMAHRADDYLSDAELESVMEKLQARNIAQGRANVQEIVMEMLDLYTGADDAEALASRSILSLRDCLTPMEKTAVLDDLRHIAGADGIMLRDERGLLTLLAEQWGVELDREHVEQNVRPEPEEGEHWGVLHDLAYIYLVLAYDTDYELSGQEIQVMLRKLQEWLPQYTEQQVRTVLNAAMECYASGPDEEVLGQAIEAVKEHLPRDKRMAALHDLIQIANADGVFLDNEEDMINNLLLAWEVDPYANYGKHGAKE